jgi:hypothetical protein
MSKILFFSFIIIWSSGISQEREKLLFEKNQVRIKAILTDCERKDNGTHIQYYYIQIENRSKNNVNISFLKEIWYNNKCISCTGSKNFEYSFSDSFPPNSIKTGDCFINTEKQYRVFSKMLNVKSNSTLTDFSISEVNINQL